MTLDRFGRALLVGGALSLVSMGAFATCDPVTFSPSGPNVGIKGYTPLPNSDVVGYKLVGTTSPVLRATCDDKPDLRQITFDTLAAGDTAGLVKWPLAGPSTAGGASTAGAAKVVIQQATVGGYAVPMTFTPNGGTTTPATLGPVTLTSAGVLLLDLRNVPAIADARKSLLLNLQVQALVKSSGFTPVGATTFSLAMGATVP